MSTANTYVNITGINLRIPAYGVYPVAAAMPPTFVSFLYRASDGTHGVAAAPSLVPAGAVIERVKPGV